MSGKELENIKWMALDKFYLIWDDSDQGPGLVNMLRGMTKLRCLTIVEDVTVREPGLRNGTTTEMKLFESRELARLQTGWNDDVADLDNARVRGKCQWLRLPTKLKVLEAYGWRIFR